MLVFEKVSSLQSFLEKERKAGHRVGFVPTMGALHEGHLSLISRSKSENDLTVCSIFVNPKQFNDKSDLENYPRDKEGDIKMLESSDCDILFYPSEQEVYPEKTEFDIDLGPIVDVLEGAFRPGHFNGMATVVKRLFEVVEPNNAYFGRKDYQQYAIVNILVGKTGMKLNVVGCETVREASGLAMSSRNRRLSEEGRETALILYRNLSLARELIADHPISFIKKQVLGNFESEKNCKLEYFEIVDAMTMQAVADNEKEKSLIACVAAYVEGIRLIDNLILIP